MKKVLFLVFGLACLGGIYGYMLWNKPHQDVAAAKADITISANSLLVAFETDEEVANTKYLDKVIMVNGKIRSVEHNDLGEISVILATENDMSSIICNFEPAFDQAESLKEGVEITLKGLCSGYLMDVVLDRCALVQ